MQDRAFWRDVIKNSYALPKDAPLLPLTDELLDYLGETDAELRDTFGYNILARWIAVYRYHSPEHMRHMLNWLIDQLPYDIGATESDSVLLRSYSASILSLILYRDVKEQFFTPEDVLTVLVAARAYLLDERDTRAYSDRLGWINATANATSLLRFTVMNPAVKAPDLRPTLTTVRDKVMQEDDPTLFSHDEEDRLARIVIAIMLRDELTTFDYVDWLQPFKSWQITLREHEADDYDRAINITFQNIKHFLRALYTQMQLKPNLPLFAHEAQTELLEIMRAYTI
ncbi:MAG: DUF2785 domain-containing protein [Chloroflexota bacterium]